MKKKALYIIGGGAVTPIGMNFAQTCAALRAGISGFNEIPRTFAVGTTQIAAKVPANKNLKKTEVEWLLNMASKAISESLNGVTLRTNEIVLMIAIPEHFRNYMGSSGTDERTVIDRIENLLGKKFHVDSAVLNAGAASVMTGLREGRGLLKNSSARMILLGGVDSYVNERDFERLGKAGRIRSEENSQGIIPGEGAAFVLISTNSEDINSQHNAVIHSIGYGDEKNASTSSSYSVGEGMLKALHAALKDGHIAEAQLNFVISNFNGERYQAWEALFYRPRFYRTRRKMFPILYPAISVGEIGAASAPLILLYASSMFSKGYAPILEGTQPVAICEFASEGSGRAACVVEPYRV